MKAVKKESAIKERIKKLLTPAGQRWLARFKLDDDELEAFLFQAEYYGCPDESLLNNCGGREISPRDINSLPNLLGTMISNIPRFYGEESRSLFVVTWNDHQNDNTKIFKAAGFKGPTRWVLNPNSGNRIRGMIGTINPNYVRKDRKEDRGDWW